LQHRTHNKRIGWIVWLKHAFSITLPIDPGPMQPVDTVSFDPHSEPLFWIGPAAVEPSLNQIRPNGRVHKVEPRVMRVLLCLAARPGEVLTREALLDAVWSDSFPNDEGLTQAVCKLRKAFGDRATRSTVIETIPKVGYRLVAPVSAQPVSSNGQAKISSNGHAGQPEHNDRQAPPPPPLRPLTYGFGDRNAEWRWLSVCFALLILFCGLWSSYVVQQPVPTEQRRIFIDNPDATAPTQRRVRIMWRVLTPVDGEKAPLDQNDTAAN